MPFVNSIRHTMNFYLKMMRISCFIFVFISISVLGFCQKQETKPEIKLVPTPTDASLRGLHAISSKVVWLTGSKGTFLRTIDSGKTWKHGSIVDSLDFRDVYAFDEDKAVVISSGYPATIFKTTNGGDSWQLTYISDDKRVFIDAIDFYDDKNGLAFGDELDGKFFMVVTSDGGETWKKLETAPEAIEGEGGFAASGTNFIITPSGTVLLGTTTGRLLSSGDRGKTWNSVQSPIESSKPTSGIFSIASNGEGAIMVGGDYIQEDYNAESSAYMDSTGNWYLIKEDLPGGFRSGVAYIPGTSMVICTGPGGTDISYNSGHSWSELSQEGFHALSFGKGKESGWMSGSKGRVAKIYLR